MFLIVQNIRKARRRPTKMGEMGIFSGLLYCAECGGKMYQCRATNFAENQKYFICSTYRKGKDLCTTHSIKNVVLHEIVLRNLREAISYVSEHEAEFIQDAAESDMRDMDAEFVRKRETLAKADTRIAELDRIISRLYEDNVIGKLSDERFIKMSHDYELEQSNLKSMAEVLRKDLKQPGAAKNQCQGVYRCREEVHGFAGSLTRLFSVLSLTGSKFPMLTRNPERGKSPSSITLSVHLTSHGQSKMPATQVKKSKERHSR